MFNRHLLQLFALVCILFGLTACQSVPPAVVQAPADGAVSEATTNSDEESSGEESQQTEMPDIGPIKIGYLPFVTHVPVFLAQEKGYFAEQGLDVELIRFQGGAAMVALESTGELDVGNGEIGTAIYNAMNSGFDVKLVAGMSLILDENYPVYLVVRQDLLDSGEVSEVSHLAGRKVGVNVERGLAEFLLAQGLALGDLSIEDVELVALPYPEVPGALANGALDASMLVAPIAQRSFAEGTSTALLTGSELTGVMQIAGMSFGSRLLEPANREIGVRVLTAIFKAIRQDMSSPDYIENEEIISIIQQYTNLPTPAIQNSPPSTLTSDGMFDEQSIIRMQTYLVEQGYTDYTELLSLDEIADQSFVQEAIERLEQAEE